MRAVIGGKLEAARPVGALEAGGVGAEQLRELETRRQLWSPATRQQRESGPQRRGCDRYNR